LLATSSRTNTGVTFIQHYVEILDSSRDEIHPTVTVISERIMRRKMEKNEKFPHCMPVARGDGSLDSNSLN
jgi:hypothetical protein